MKVLQICSKPPLPEIDGGCKAMNNITKGLLANNVQVKVLTISTFKHPFLPEKMGEEYTKNTQIKSAYLDIKVKAKDAFINLFSQKSYNINRFCSKKFEEIIAQSLQEDNYDIILLESLYVTPYIQMIRENTDTKIIYRAHNIEHEIWERNLDQESKRLKRKYLQLLVKRLKRYEISVLNQVDAIAAISQKDKTTLQALGAKKPITVTPFGFELAKTTTNSYKIDTVKSLFHIGSMDWFPNQEGIKWLLENVWDKVVDQYPHLHLNLAGKSMPEWMQNWKQKNVNIIGEVDDAIKFIQENDIMVVPLFVGSGMRIKIIEGMALGKPVIATTIATEGIKYKNNVDILIADTVDEFVLAIKKTVEDVSVANKIGENAKKMITSDYDNKVIVNNLVMFFKQII